MAVSRKGIEFESLDGEPVQLFFLLVSPPDRPGDHLRALENISRQLRDDGFCKRLKASQTPAEIEHLLEGLTRKQRKQLIASWPGPTTWLIPDIDDQVPSWIKGRYESVAVRVTAHPIEAALCKSLGGPVVSTSANRNNQPPVRNALQIVKHLGKDIDGILHGSLGCQKSPFTIIDALTGKVLR